MSEKKYIPAVFLGQVGSDKHLVNHALIKLVLKRLERLGFINCYCDQDDNYAFKHANDLLGFRISNRLRLSASLDEEQRLFRYIEDSDCIVYFLSKIGCDQLEINNNFVYVECNHIKTVWLDQKGSNNFFIPIYNDDYPHRENKKIVLPSMLIREGTGYKLCNSGVAIEKSSSYKDILTQCIVKLNYYFNFFGDDSDGCKIEHKIDEFVHDCLEEINKITCYEDVNRDVSSTNIEKIIVNNECPGDIFNALFAIIKMGREIFSRSDLRSILINQGYTIADADSKIDLTLSDQIIKRTDFNETEFYIPQASKITIINAAYVRGQS